jgi:DNA recombination protein Rad52
MSDATPAHRAGFSLEQIAALAAPLDRANVKQREQSGQKLSYIEGWVVIAEANRIFGFDGWQRETVTLKCVSQLERPVGKQQRPGWGVTYSARVRITVTAGGLSPIIREGSGAGHGIDVDLGQAHESALKEAETDAMKRALMTFGNPFGLALYDKLQREVEGDAPPASGSQRSSSQRTERPGSSAPRQSSATVVRRGPAAGQPAPASQPPATQAPAQPQPTGQPLTGAAATTAAAVKACQESGLTDAGIAAMALEISKGKYANIAGLSVRSQEKFITDGVPAEFVAKWNAAGANAADSTAEAEDSDPPMTWGAPVAA